MKGGKNSKDSLPLLLWLMQREAGGSPGHAASAWEVRQHTYARGHAMDVLVMGW